jgi:hypothetical protein
MRCIISLLASLALALATAPLAAQTAQAGSAQELWKAYLDLSGHFDPALADLYADDAVVRNSRRYPDGHTRTLEWSGKEYQSLIRQAMPVARSRGDLDLYSNVRFKAIGDQTRVTATRYSTLKKYYAPHELILQNVRGVGWRIVGETGHSRP